MDDQRGEVSTLVPCWTGPLQQPAGVARTFMVTIRQPFDASLLRKASSLPSLDLAQGAGGRRRVCSKLCMNPVRLLLCTLLRT